MIYTQHPSLIIKAADLLAGALSGNLTGNRSALEFLVPGTFSRMNWVFWVEKP